MRSSAPTARDARYGRAPSVLDRCPLTPASRGRSERLGAAPRVLLPVVRGDILDAAGRDASRRGLQGSAVPNLTCRELSDRHVDEGGRVSVWPVLGQVPVWSELCSPAHGRGIRKRTAVVGGLRVQTLRVRNVLRHNSVRPTSSSPSMRVARKRDCSCLIPAHAGGFRGVGCVEAGPAANNSGLRAVLRRNAQRAEATHP